MKCVIVYFSQTGNTELIARKIQEGVEKAAGHCDIVAIKEANPRRLYEYDLIGIGCPIMGFREPPNVRAFINDMRFVGGKHAFVFATHGTRPEFFFPSIVPLLRRRGLIVTGMYNCYATCYMSSMPDPYPTARHPDEIDLKEAEDFGRETVECSRRIYAGETGLIPPLPTWSETGLDLYLQERRKREMELGVPEIRARRKSMIRLHKEKCRYPECRICMDNCPMDGIDLSVKPPVVAKPCMRCGFCLKICPTGAIINEAFSVPVPGEVSRAVFTEFYLKPLEKAEAEGRFRRLVPVEEIGWDTPLYKTHSKPPMWVVGKGLQ